MQIGSCMPLAKCLRALRFMSVFRGWYLVLRFLFDHDRQKGSDLTFPFCGVVYPGSSSYLVDWSAFFYGAYEKPWLEFCLNRLADPKTATVVDIGGNIGHHALWFAAHGCTVHSFEPSEALWPEIERKSGTPGLPGSITLHRTAMGAANETREFLLPDGTNQGTGSFEHEPYNWGGRRAQLKISAASEYLQSAGIATADLIKIDVEGFEMDVLTGLKPFLQRVRPVLWVEISATTPERRVDLDILRHCLSGAYRFYCARQKSRLLTVMSFTEIDTMPDQNTIDIVAVPD